MNSCGCGNWSDPPAVSLQPFGVTRKTPDDTADKDTSTNDASVTQPVLIVEVHAPLISKAALLQQCPVGARAYLPTPIPSVRVYPLCFPYILCNRLSSVINRTTLGLDRSNCHCERGLSGCGCSWAVGGLNMECRIRKHRVSQCSLSFFNLSLPLSLPPAASRSSTLSFSPSLSFSFSLSLSLSQSLS